MNGSVAATETASATTQVVSEPEIVTNVPSEVIESKQTAVTKLPKAKQLDSLPKSRPCDLPSPKNKTPDASSSSKNKFDAFKDRPPNAPKHRTSFSNSKNNESSSKERVNDMPANAKTDHISKNSDAFPAKEKPNQGHNKSRVLDSCSNKSKSVDNELSLLSVNGHVDSESTVSSEVSTWIFKKYVWNWNLFFFLQFQHLISWLFEGSHFKCLSINNHGSYSGMVFFIRFLFFF